MEYLLSVKHINKLKYTWMAFGIQRQLICNVTLNLQSQGKKNVLICEQNFNIFM